MPEKKEAALLPQDDLNGSNHDAILTTFDAVVKSHDLYAALKLANISSKDAVNLIHQQFPSFDKTMLSKCCKPDKYGCVLHPDGYAMLRQLGFGDTPQNPPQRRRRSGNKLTCRVSGRLPDDKFLLLQQYIRKEGYATTQEWVAEQVEKFIEAMKEKYETDGTPNNHSD